MIKKSFAYRKCHHHFSHIHRYQLGSWAAQPIHPQRPHCLGAHQIPLVADSDSIADMLQHLLASRRQRADA